MIHYSLSEINQEEKEVKNINICNPGSLEEYQENMKKILMESVGACNNAYADNTIDLCTLMKSAIKRMDKLIRHLNKLDAKAELQYEWMLEHNKQKVAEEEIQICKTMISDSLASKVEEAIRIREVYIGMLQREQIPQEFPAASGDNR